MSKVQKITIKGCAQCPFMSGFTGDSTSGRCTVGNGTAAEDLSRAIPDTIDVDNARPRWCPLNKGPIEVHAGERA